MNTLLVVQHEGNTTEYGPGVVTVGRGAGNHIGFPASATLLSREHMEFRADADGWRIVDKESTNGTFLNGTRITEALLDVGKSYTVSLGGTTEHQIGVMVYSAPSLDPVIPTATVARPSRQMAGPPSHGYLTPGIEAPVRRLLVGRAESNDIVLNDPIVSRRHAEIKLGNQSTIRDLGSFNGVYLNGVLLKGESPLSAGDEIVFGNELMRWDGTDLRPAELLGQPMVSVRSLGVHVGKGARGRQLMDDVSFDLMPGSLTAVIGPSGAGKSTLLGALTGTKPATEGQVLWKGHDFYKNYHQLRYQVGLVPQSDIQHSQLTVRQALKYSAQLRLAPDLSDAERAKRVDEVVARMQLEKQIDNQIGKQLSGGQRKRVSIATELLTAPPALYLDEPTSGLDPALDREVMQQLRSLADDGRIVVVVTHSVLALDVCDNVLVLAPGGKVAFHGPPKKVLEYFGVPDYPAVFAKLERTAVSAAANRPRTSPEMSPIEPIPLPKRLPISRQTKTLVARNLAVIRSDRLLLSLFVLMPMLLGLLSRVVQGRGGKNAGFSLDRTLSATGAGGIERYFPTEINQRLTILVVAAALMGTSVTIRELVGEREIFRREHSVGLSPFAYISSKALIFCTACFFQGMLVTYLATVGLPKQDSGGLLDMGWLELAVPIGLLTSCVALVGLCASSLVSSSEQTMPVLVGLVMVQLVFSSALVPMSGRPILNQLSWLSPSRWAYAASAASVDLERAKKTLDGKTLDGEKIEALFRHSPAIWSAEVLLLVQLGAILFGSAYLLLVRSTKR